MPSKEIYLASGFLQRIAYFSFVQCNSSKLYLIYYKLCDKVCFLKLHILKWMLRVIGAYWLPFGHLILHLLSSDYTFGKYLGSYSVVFYYIKNNDSAYNNLQCYNKFCLLALLLQCCTKKSVRSSSTYNMLQFVLRLINVIQ